MKTYSALLSSQLAALIVFTGLTPVAAANDALGFIQVGVAKVDVTPQTPAVLAGYGGRTQPFQGVDSKLWARAIVLGTANPVVIVVLDNCGVPATVRNQLATRLVRRGIAQTHLMVAATHTHNAPTLVGYAPIVWAGRTSAAMEQATADYTEFAVEQMESAVVTALDKREAMKVQWGRGRVTFGGNRRVLSNSSWQGFGLQRDGPVDHSLPVLAGTDRSGKVRFVWANYACHCTTVGSRNTVGGDWAGYANAEIESRFPNATSLMTIGCGADVGPQPSGSLQLAQQHGQSIATEVARVLAGSTQTLNAEPTVVSQNIQLPLQTPPPREYWEKRIKETTGFQFQLAKSMLKKLDQLPDLPPTVEYPISLCSFGNELAIVFLGGEVVVDYALRLSGELDWDRLWVTAWTNGMPGYIPSRRVLAEGGYEADFSQVYYDQPTRYHEDVENILVESVKRLAGPRFTSIGKQPPPDTHHPDPKFRWVPDHQKQTFTRLNARMSDLDNDQQQRLLKKIKTLIAEAEPGLTEDTLSGGKSTQWNDFAGDQVQRRFIRQTNRSSVLQWTKSVTNGKNNRPRVFCFSGGLGWTTEPTTKGFSLEINGTAMLRFDVTRQVTRWQSGNAAVELYYLPTWTSDLDSGGFFVLSCSHLSLPAENTIRFSVRSLGEGSQRWFAVDAAQEMPERLESLRAAMSQRAE